MPSPSSRTAPLKAAAARRNNGRLVLAAAAAVYLVVSLLFFFLLVDPSLNGGTTQHIAADSGTYMYFATSLREGRNDPFVLTSLASFPNTLWGPVLVALALKSTLAIVVFDYALLLWSLYLIRKAVDLQVGVFLFLLFANITTTVSLVSVNKEILDLFVTSLFVHYLVFGRRKVLVAAVLIALVARYETAVVMLLYSFLLSRWNPLRRRRGLTLVVTTVALSIFLSGVIGGALRYRLEEALNTASSGGLLLILDNLQLHYLYFVAVIPKILDNLFSELIFVSHWSQYSLDEAANSYFIMGNNLANASLLLYLFLGKRLTLRSNLVYYACLSAIFMSTALIIQPRYFFGTYLILCIEASRRRPRTLASAPDPAPAHLCTA